MQIHRLNSEATYSRRLYSAHTRIFLCFNRIVRIAELKDKESWESLLDTKLSRVRFSRSVLTKLSSLTLLWLSIIIRSVYYKYKERPSLTQYWQILTLISKLSTMLVLGVHRVRRLLYSTLNRCIFGYIFGLSGPFRRTKCRHCLPSSQIRLLFKL